MRYFVSSILIIFSGYYITSLALSPIYFSFAIAIFISMFIFILLGKFPKNSLINLSFVFIVYLIVSQLLTGGMFKVIINVVFSIVYFCLTIIFLHGVDNVKIYKISYRFLTFSIVLLVIEACWRLSHPKFEYVNEVMKNKDLQFYAYKYSSIMYQDSNFVSIFIVSLFAFLLYLDQNTGKRSYIMYLILCVLCVLTFSRASIIVLLLYCILYLFFRSTKSMKKSARIYMYLLCANVLVLAILVVLSLFAKDPSFSTKFDILNSTYDFYKNANLQQILFGVGFGNTVNYFGRSAHNFILTYLIESGLCGFILLGILWINILKKTKLQAAIVMVPFLMSGMSLAGHAISYIYTMFGIIFILTNRPQDMKMKIMSLKVNKNLGEVPL